MSQPLKLDLKAKRQRKREDYPWVRQDRSPDINTILKTLQHEDYRTRWSDNDMFFHMNNPAYGADMMSSVFLWAAG